MNYIYDQMLAVGLLTIIVLAAVLWIAHAMAYHRRLRNIRLNSRWKPRRRDLRVPRTRIDDDPRSSIVQLRYHLKH